MTSLLYEHYKEVCEAKESAYRADIRALAERLVAEGKSFGDMAELFMGSTKCVAFDHALFCYYLHFREVAASNATVAGTAGAGTAGNCGVTPRRPAAREGRG